ncbi:hypothetical protein ABLG96_08880 [Nakamurella sp. A5-74]|uniref:Trypsin-like serine protease n=1 Tax=Nakamurella sp. A5-74 TaxID=3158264 RepID=A0AAU8DSU5_9ACTN
MTGSVDLPELTSAEAEDAVRFAEQHQLDPIGETLRARGMNQFAALSSSLQDRYPGIYVDAAWVPKPELNESKAWISFTSAPPSALIAEIAATGIPVDLQVLGVPSRLERLRATALVHFEATSQLGTTDISTTADSATGVLTLTTSSISLQRSEALEISLTKALATNGLNAFTVHVVIVNQPVAILQRGGLRIGGCTGAFSVRKVSVYGISTAAHCGTQASTYDSRPITFQQSASPGADVAWYKFNSGTATSKFQYRRNLYRDVTAAINPVKGQTACVFGFGTADTGSPSGLCSTVEVVDSCTASQCYAIIAREKVTKEGDSGGPWYFGTEAKGVHNGETIYSGAYRSFFARISTLNGLGLYVLTQ